MKKKSEFFIGDIVCMRKDDFHFNPSDDCLSVGKIESIHFKTGKGLFEGEDTSGIVYGISGFNLRPREDALELFERFAEGG